MPAKPLAQLEKTWIETGALPHTPSTESLPEEERQQYRRWMLLERSLQPSKEPLEERWKTPSTVELERGFQRVWEQHQHTKRPVAMQQDFTKRMGWLSWLQYNVMHLGVVTALLLVVVWAGQEPQQDGAWIKGKTTRWSRTGPQQIQLQFGLGEANSAQVTQRGRSGMVVKSGQWVYFRWSKQKAAGYLYLILYKNNQDPQILYPEKDQVSYIKEGKRSWLMTLQNTVVRYKVPSSPGVLGFVGILSPHRIPKQRYRMLRQQKIPLESRKGMLLKVLNTIKQPRQWVDGFLIRIPSNPKK